MKNKSERSGAVNMDSENSDYKRSSRNFQNRSNPSDNPQTGIDDDDDFNVDDVDDTYDYGYDDNIDDQTEIDDSEHDHAYKVPVAEDEDDEYFNESRPQDDRF